MSLALRTRDVFDDPVQGICCPAILVFSTFYINHKPSPKKNLEKSQEFGKTLGKTLNEP